jgi:hypothetical protein
VLRVHPGGKVRSQRFRLRGREDHTKLRWEDAARTVGCLSLTPGAGLQPLAPTDYPTSRHGGKLLADVVLDSRDGIRDYSVLCLPRGVRMQTDLVICEHGEGGQRVVVQHIVVPLAVRGPELLRAVDLSYDGNDGYLAEPMPAEVQNPADACGAWEEELREAGHHVDKNYFFLGKSDTVAAVDCLRCKEPVEVNTAILMDFGWLCVGCFSRYADSMTPWAEAEVEALKGAVGGGDSGKRLLQPGPQCKFEDLTQPPDRRQCQEPQDLKASNNPMLLCWGHRKACVQCWGCGAVTLAAKAVHLLCTACAEKAGPCQTSGCTRLAGAESLCAQHGRRRCQHADGCYKQARDTTTHLCSAHGGGPRCSYDGCTKGAYSVTDPFCTAHGGGLRCSYDGCTKGALSAADPFCKAHGGGPRCSYDGCTKAARSAADTYCIAHGGGPRCTYDGCTKPAVQPQWKFCRTHEPCDTRGCPNKTAWDKGGLCTPCFVRKALQSELGV